MLPQPIRKYLMDCLKVSSEQHIQDDIELSDGKSGAQVYRVKVISRRERLSGTYVIKCCDMTDKWYTHSGSEVERYKQLCSCVPPSYKNRLVELPYEKQIGDLHVLVYRQANDSTIHSKSFDKLSDNRRNNYLSLVSKELLTEFNAECLTDNSLLTTDISQFFLTTLDYRIKNRSGERGTFYKKLDDILDDPTADTIQIDSHLYPNPGYFLQNQAAWIPADATYNLRHGLMHGDLHSKNIICSDSDQLAYSVIDYDSFKEDGFLFFDHAYLELYMYLYECNMGEVSIWESMMKSLLVPDIYTPVLADSIPYFDGFSSLQIRNTICASITDWVNDKCAHFRDDFDVQFCLARIAAGINFFSKGGIHDYDTLKRILLYIGINFEVLFMRLNFETPQRKISKICELGEKQKIRDHLWINCVSKAMRGYIPVLITDDAYEPSDYTQMAPLSVVPWGLVWDCGNRFAPDDFGSAIRPEMVKRRHINNFSPDLPPSIQISSNSCLWLSIKKESGRLYRSTLAPHLRKITKLWQTFLSSNGLGPYIFIFDCKADHPAAEKIRNLIDESISRLHGSYFISLRDKLFDKELTLFYKENQCTAYNMPAATLIDFSNTVEYFHGASEDQNSNGIVLPHLDSIPPIPLSSQELAFYQTSVELVYADMLIHDKNDAAEKINFYRGNEITWSCIAHNYDLKLISDYEQKLNLLQVQLEQGTPHIRTLKIMHGAGTGGTTLSKRLLWDLRNVTPTLRLCHYTADTADIIIEIYNKCKKTVLLSVEAGSSVISAEDLVKLCDDVHARNARLWILQVERTNSTAWENGDEPFIYLPDTLPTLLARQFYNKFCGLTTNSDRRRCLENVTNSVHPTWIARRCPFFYGFYTYEEDYRLHSISRTISKCSNEIKTLLSDMALGTIYSQNYIIKAAEMASRLLGYPDDTPLLAVMDRLDPSVSKFIVVQNKGLRICHPIIAQKILCEIYAVTDYKDCVYQASAYFIDRIYSIYGDSDELVDAILRELFIDRTEVDKEKMKFSTLVQDIPEYTKKKALFEKLIKLYPNNPHYYNHMARLHVSQESPDFEKAIQLMDEAIQIAGKNGTASIHYVTLGSVYSKKIKLLLQAVQYARKTGRYSPPIGNILREISNDYQAAYNAFTMSRTTGNPKSSYVYFPHILLESTIIAQLVECDRKERSIGELFHQNEDFHTWYCEHYAIAVQIYEEMQRNCKDFITDARQRLDEIDLKDSAVEDSLRELVNSTESAVMVKRAYATALYSRSHYSWNNLGQSSLALIELAMRQNLLGQVKGTVSRDIDFWFEAYRRLPNFNTDDAIQMLVDYKEDSYQKEYLLSILYFQKLVKGLANPQDVRNHIVACKSICPGIINTTYWHDTYADDAIGCPIISKNDVQRKVNGELVGLRFFTGIIENISASSSGTILIDHLNIDATFLPIITDENNNRREFTSQHLQARVKFNLMFSYSGLRAWNVTLHTDASSQKA